MPLMAKYAVDAFAADRSPVTPLIALTALVLAGACLSAYGRYLMARTGEGVVLRARDQLVGRIMRLKVPAVDRLTPATSSPASPATPPSCERSFPAAWSSRSTAC